MRSKATRLLRFAAATAAVLLISAGDTSSTTLADTAAATANSNVFHTITSHTVEPELMSSTVEDQAKRSCSDQCSGLKTGRFYCTVLCKCKLRCINRFAFGTGRMRKVRYKRRRCRRVLCPLQAERKVTRRKAKRAELKAAAEAARMALDDETRENLLTVRGASEDGMGMFRSSPTAYVPYVLPIFDERKPVQTYGRCADLERDVQAAAAYTVNKMMDECTEDGGIYYTREEDMVLADAPAAAKGEAEQVTEDSFETNTQEEDVDESDHVKSDGERVYIAFGQEIVTSDAKTGQILARTDTRPQAVTDDETDGTYRYVSNGQVEGLLLHDCILSAIVTGYTYRYLYCDDGTNKYDPPILSDMGSTSLRLYDVCNNVPNDGNSSLTLLATHDLRGRFVDSRSIDGTVHVVTQSSVDLWYHLTRHLDRWSKSRYRKLNCTEYKAKAANDSITYIREFGNLLVSEIMEVAGDDCTNVARIVAYAAGADDFSNEGNSTGSDGGGMGAMPDDIVGMGSFLSVTSLKHGAPEDAATTLPSTTSAFFMGEYSNIVYASVDNIVVASNSWRFWSSGGDQVAYLMSWQLQADGSPAKGGGTGIVPGYIKDSYSMSERNGYLRIATTSREKWVCRDPPPEEEKPASDLIWWCRGWCCNGRDLVANSTSQVMILSLPGAANGTMEMISSVGDLGETEEIKSVRFFDDYVVVVTFRQTDPLYTIGLTGNPPKATYIGELKIDGFSSNLQPYPTDDGSQILLAVGQSADLEGRVLGLQLSLFNVTDLTNPQLIIRHNVENRTDQWSYSEAEFEPKALRFLPISKLLLLPAYVGGDPSFDGFLVFKVTPQSIETRYSISMVESDVITQRICRSCAYVQSRSIVIGGVATFIKGRSMKNVALTDGASLWNQTLDRPIMRKEDCCWSYIYSFPFVGLCSPIADDVSRPAVESEMVLVDEGREGGR
mmetsp:Transcript_7854/g.17112  ORF Transcript_7854/g.17112 Transcript_7854/m.17112 type:complete len:949 (-) Transcript_7854:177-3023(-)